MSTVLIYNLWYFSYSIISIGGMVHKLCDRTVVREKIIKRDRQRCTYCHGKGTAQKEADGHSWHVDHIEPRALGGKEQEENLTLACRMCTVQKGARRRDEFLALRTRP